MMAPLIVSALAGEKRRDAQARAARAQQVRAARRARGERVIRLPDTPVRSLPQEETVPARTT